MAAPASSTSARWRSRLPRARTVGLACLVGHLLIHEVPTALWVAWTAWAAFFGQ